MRKRTLFIESIVAVQAPLRATRSSQLGAEHRSAITAGAGRSAVDANRSNAELCACGAQRRAGAEQHWLGWYVRVCAACVRRTTYSGPQSFSLAWRGRRDPSTLALRSHDVYCLCVLNVSRVALLRLW